MKYFKNFSRQKVLMISVLAFAFMVVASAAFAALTFTATTTTTDGNYTLNGVAGSVYSIGAATTTGTVTIGGTAGTGAMTFGSSTGVGQTVNVGSGNSTGADVLNLGTGTATTSKTVNIATGAISAVNIGTGNFVNTIKIGDHATPVNVITIGGAASSLALADAQWSVTSPGVATFVNALVTASATTGVDTAAAGALSLGNVTATSVSVCNSATCDTITIGTNADADTITIGDSTDTTVSITDDNWSITAAGVGTLVNLLVSPSATTGVDVGSAGALSVGRVNATSVVIGSAATTSLTVTTDGTGTAEVALPAGSIDSTETLDDTLTASDLNATLTFADADNVSFASVSVTAANEGLVLPLHATDCTTANASVIVDGQVCWESDANTLYIGDGDNFIAIPSSLGSANTWTTTNTYTPATNVSGIALVGTNVTTATLATVTSSALTTGGALSVTATNTALADTAAGISPVLLAVTNAQGTAAQTLGGGFSGLRVNFTNAPTIAANTENMAMIQNQVTTNATDNAVATGLLIDNADTSATGSTVITDALRITNSGAIAGGITNAINIASTTVTTDLSLQNGLTISNDVDSELALVENARTLNLDFAEVASRIKLESASEVEVESTSNTTSAIVIDATVGGINITASGAAATEDITVVATGSSIGLTATESINDAIRITASGANGAIVLAAGEATAAGTNATVSVISETIFDNTANVSFAAQTVLDATAAVTVTPTSSYVILQCNRAGPADTAITMSETGAVSGQLLIFTVDGVTNTAGTCSLADSAGVQQGAATTIDDFDALTLIYDGAQWVQIATSNN